MSQIFPSQSSSDSAQTQNSYYEIESSFVGENLLAINPPSASVLLASQIGLDENSSNNSPEASNSNSVHSQKDETNNPFTQAKDLEFKRINIEGGEIVPWDTQDEADSELNPSLKTEPKPDKIEQLKRSNSASSNISSSITKDPSRPNEAGVAREGLKRHGANKTYFYSSQKPEGSRPNRIFRRDIGQTNETHIPLSNASPRVLPHPSNTKTRNRWSDVELKALERGMLDHGTRWANILADHGVHGRISQDLARRSQVQLKDKARSERRIREREGKALGVFSLACSRS
ncbi:hypothetical protein DSO57_1038531 [Entomophthora muscae]|uniref:Uncharacterized protein n=1 Tax=Entomophthora muscae TaxID=34485 RepID=A0ACC2UJE4_9FUNG|nr:hypothetical protein DSO57_1038531 [Entomophthora muscae]